MKTHKLAALFVMVSAAALFSAAQPQVSFCQDQGAVTLYDRCMQDIAGFNLNCTANDINIAGVYDSNQDGVVDKNDIEILDDDGGCAYPGDTVTFRAKFIVELNAKARHDIGIYFSTDGDLPKPGELTGDGALTGDCSISTINYMEDPPWLDLDGTSDNFEGTNKIANIQDTCGDIDTAHSPLYPEIEITTTCIDTDGNGTLNLPYCTTWRQPGVNSLCTGPLPDSTSSGVYPGSPSKCRCDINFEVPIDVPPAELIVTKTSDIQQVTEPGGDVTFTITVTKTDVDPLNLVNLQSLTDSVYGDITYVHDAISSTNCNIPQTIYPNNPYKCNFTAYVNNEGFVGSEMDVVTATGVDSRNPPNNLKGSDDATVEVMGVSPTMIVEKMPDPDIVTEEGGYVKFTVTVTNTGVSSDPITLDNPFGLMDSAYGDITYVHDAISSTDCSSPQTIRSDGEPYQCSFMAFVSGPPGSEEDKITASGTDDEGVPVVATGTATVTISNLPASIEVQKTATPTHLPEPGGEVTYTAVITNTSVTDTITLNSLFDDQVEFDIRGCIWPDGSSVSIPGALMEPKEFFTCTYTGTITGLNAFDTYTNTLTACGTDDDGFSDICDDDTSDVTIDNVSPSASLTKNIDSAVVTYEVMVCNESAVEELKLTSLWDDQYGDITIVNEKILRTDCSLPDLDNNDQVRWIDLSQCYTCTFDAIVDGSGITDEVIGTLTDDDGSTPVTPMDSATVNLVD